MRWLSDRGVSMLRVAERAVDPGIALISAFAAGRIAYEIEIPDRWLVLALIGNYAIFFGCWGFIAACLFALRDWVRRALGPSALRGAKVAVTERGRGGEP